MYIGNYGDVSWDEKVSGIPLKWINEPDNLCVTSLWMHDQYKLFFNLYYKEVISSQQTVYILEEFGNIVPERLFLHMYLTECQLRGRFGWRSDFMFERVKEYFGDDIPFMVRNLRSSKNRDKNRLHDYLYGRIHSAEWSLEHIQFLLRHLPFRDHTGLYVKIFTRSLSQKITISWFDHIFGWFNVDKYISNHKIYQYMNLFRDYEKCVIRRAIKNLIMKIN